jgi:hypothetical protein
LERKKKARPSRDQRGEVSFFSFVNVICRVEDTPCLIDTTYKSD